ncbi:hypothetical protein D3C86_2009210 [compost metagenome]
MQTVGLLTFHELVKGTKQASRTCAQIVINNTCTQSSNTPQCTTDALSEVDVEVIPQFSRSPLAPSVGLGQFTDATGLTGNQGISLFPVFLPYFQW